MERAPGSESPPPAAPADDPWLRRFLEGDAAACRKAEGWIRDLIRYKGYGIPPAEYDDLVQETLAGVWRAAAAPGFTLRVGLQAFVRQVALARCVDWLRRRRPTEELDPALPAGGPNPYDDLLAADRRARVRWALLQLDRGCREIMRLHFVEERSYAQIALRLGRAEATMRVRMFQCIRRVRRLLERWPETLAVALLLGPWNAAGEAATEAARPAAGELRAAADSLYRAGDLARADSAYARAWDRLQAEPGAERAARAHALLCLADTRQRRGELASAATLYERLLDLRDSLRAEAPALLAAAENNAGVLATLRGDWDAASARFEAALALLPDTSSAAVLYNVGIARLTQGGGSDATELCRRAVALWAGDILPGAGDPRATMEALSSLPLAPAALAAGPLGGFIEGRVRAFAGSLFHPGVPHPCMVVPQTTSNALNEVADHARWAEALAPLFPLVERGFGAGHPDAVYPLLLMADLNANAGAGASAMRLLERALGLCERTLGPRHHETGLVLNSLAIQAAELGDQERAREFYLRSIEVLEASLGPESPFTLYPVNNLGLLLSDEGDQPAALPLLRRVLAAAESRRNRDPVDLARALNNVAMARWRMGDAAGAVPLYERALALKEAALGAGNMHLVGTLAGLGGARLDLGQPAEARALFERALLLCERAHGAEHPWAGWTHYQLARAQAAGGDGPAAFASALRAQAITREHVRASLRGLSERQGLLYATDPRAALDLVLRLALDGAEPPDSARIAPAWDAVIRSRSLVFDELLARRRAAAGSGDDGRLAQLEERVRRARQRLAALTLQALARDGQLRSVSALAAAREERDAAEGALAAESAAFRAAGSRASIGLDAVRAALPPESALVAYVRHGADAGYLAFTLTAAGLRAFELGPAAELDSLVARWSDTVASPPSGPLARAREESDCRSAGAALRARVWDPLAGELAAARLVFLVPDAALHLVNFAALPAPEPASGPAPEARYLADERWTMHYLTTERDLVRDPPQDPGPAALGAPAAPLLLGDPAFDLAPREPAADAMVASAPASPSSASRSGCRAFAGVRFDPLPGSAREVAELASLWRRGAGPGADSGLLALTGEEASEEAFRRLAPGRAALHLATHGFFLGGECAARPGAAHGPLATWLAENPSLLSGLALAGANRRADSPDGGRDGILTAEEVASLDLSAAGWAVLSACDAGVGDVRAGEGVFGLQRAFLAAGARTVVMSLWPVADEDARDWMNRLYGARLLGGRDTAAAVREASGAILRERRGSGRDTHPRRWAAFVAVGDWN